MVREQDERDGESWMFVEAMQCNHNLLFCVAPAYTQEQLALSDLRSCDALVDSSTNLAALLSHYVRLGGLTKAPKGSSKGPAGRGKEDDTVSARKVRKLAKRLRKSPTAPTLKKCHREYTKVQVAYLNCSQNKVERFIDQQPHLLRLYRDKSLCIALRTSLYEQVVIAERHRMAMRTLSGAQNSQTRSWITRMSKGKNVRDTERELDSAKAMFTLLTLRAYEQRWIEPKPKTVQHLISGVGSIFGLFRSSCVWCTPLKAIDTFTITDTPSLAVLISSTQALINLVVIYGRFHARTLPPTGDNKVGWHTPITEGNVRDPRLLAAVLVILITEPTVEALTVFYSEYYKVLTSLAGCIADKFMRFVQYPKTCYYGQDEPVVTSALVDCISSMVEEVTDVKDRMKKIGRAKSRDAEWQRLCLLEGRDHVYAFDHMTPALQLLDQLRTRVASARAAQMAAARAKIASSGGTTSQLSTAMAMSRTQGVVLEGVDASTFAIDPKDIDIDKDAFKGGGEASVYGGTYRGQPVAVKVHMTEPCESAVVRQQMLLTCSLKHDGIVRHLGWYESTNATTTTIFSLVMERGSCSLMDGLERIPIPDRLPLFIKITMAIDFLHMNDILHCDLKPENIILFWTGPNECIPKLCDFGMAGSVKRTKQEAQSVATVRGYTLRYAAPEMLQKDAKVGRKADVFSLGGIAYFMATNRMPFHDATNAIEVMLRVMKAEMPPVGDIPEPWNSVITAAWQEKPDDRPTAAELLKLID